MVTKLKLKSGKEIELTESELEEMKQYFSENTALKYIPYSHPVNVPTPWFTNQPYYLNPVEITCTETGGDIFEFQTRGVI